MRTEKHPVAIVYKACPICGNTDRNQRELLFSMKKQDLSAIEGVTAGFGDPCQGCQNGLDKGAIMIIVSDRDKSGTEFKDLHRTGNVFGVKESWVIRAIQEPLLHEVLLKRIIVLDYREAKAIGLPVDYQP